MALHRELQRCYDLAIRGAWAHPFFLIPLGHCEWKEGDPKEVPTMEIHSVIKQGKPEINLYINTEWSKTLADDEVFGVLSHEILHAMLRHHERSGGRTSENWGKACDMAINASLESAGIKPPKTALLPPRDHWEDAAEDLYALLDAEQIPPPKNYDPTKATQGCMPKKNAPGSGDSESDSEGQGEGQGQGNGEGEGNGNGEGDGNGDSQGQSQGQGQSNSDRAWGELCAQSQSYSRGTGTAKVMAKLFKPKPVKTLWERLLRKVANRAQAKGGRDTQTYQRINRRSQDIIFPGWLSTSPSIGVIIDTSGSVSDDMLRASLTSVTNIAKSTSVRIFLALHDGDCYYHDWVKPEITVEQLSTLCAARGGTDPNEAFEEMGKAKGRFDACVYLTDGEVGEYPQKPLNVKRMIVGVVGDGKYRAKVPDAWQEVLVEIVESKD